MSEKKSQEELNADAIGKAVQQALEIAIPMASKVNAEVARAGQPKQVFKRMPTGGHCQACGQPQFVDGASIFYACAGEHVRMTVLPVEDQEWFQGVFVNGVKYLSADGGAIVVPAANDIVSLLQGWDKQARLNKKTRDRQTGSYLSNPVYKEEGR